MVTGKTEAERTPENYGHLPENTDNMAAKTVVDFRKYNISVETKQLHGNKRQNGRNKIIIFRKDIKKTKKHLSP